MCPGEVREGKHSSELLSQVPLIELCAVSACASRYMLCCPQVVVRYSDTTGAGTPPLSTGASPAAAAGNMTCPPGGCWIASLENVKVFMQRTLSYQVHCRSARLGSLFMSGKDSCAPAMPESTTRLPWSWGLLR